MGKKRGKVIINKKKLKKVGFQANVEKKDCVVQYLNDFYDVAVDFVTIMKTHDLLQKFKEEAFQLLMKTADGVDFTDALAPLLLDFYCLASEKADENAKSLIQKEMILSSSTTTTTTKTTNDTDKSTNKSEEFMEKRKQEMMKVSHDKNAYPPKSLSPHESPSSSSSMMVTTTTSGMKSLPEEENDVKIVSSPRSAPLKPIEPMMATTTTTSGAKSLPEEECDMKIVSSPCNAPLKPIESMMVTTTTSGMKSLPEEENDVKIESSPRNAPLKPIEPLQASSSKFGDTDALSEKASSLFDSAAHPINSYPEFRDKVKNMFNRTKIQTGYTGDECDSKVYAAYCITQDSINEWRIQFHGLCLEYGYAIDIMKQDIARLNMKNEKYEQDIARLNMKNEKYEQDTARLNMKNEKYEQDIARLNMKNEEYEQDIARLNMKNEKYEQDIAKMMGDIKFLYSKWKSG